MNIPDNWVILKIIAKSKSKSETFYKVLAGWSGGYLDGDSWRLNSGIEKVEKHGDYYHFIGYSGSIYKCNKNSECLSGITTGVLQQLLEIHPDAISLVKVSEIKLN
jgi:hypothetical protein